MVELKKNWPHQVNVQAEEDKAASKRQLQEARALRAREASGWISMGWRQFELECARIMRKHGFKAQVTSESADKGVDIIAKKKGQEYAVQCKHWKNWRVGRPEVQQLAGVVAIERYDRGIIIALRDLTDGASESARKAGIEVWDVEDLVRMANAHGQDPD
jgi:HJR/Mrr/RecB family endonuclease